MTKKPAYMLLNYKKSLTAAVLVAVTFLYTAPHAYAAAETKTAKNKNFCISVVKKENKLQTKLAIKDSDLAKQRTDRDSKLAKQRAEVDAKLTETRNSADTKRTQEYTKLMGKATTEAQKQAVAKYKTAITNALTSRRTAVNAAIKNFRTGVDSTIKAHKASIDKALATFKASVAAAQTKAETDCAAGIDSAVVQQNFVKAITEAHEKLKTERDTLAKVGPQIDALTKTRQTTIDKAFADFKATAEKAKIDLKAAFGK